MYKLLDRDKAFLCHQPRLRFCGWDGGDPGQNAVLWAPPLTCGLATATATMNAGGVSIQSSPFVVISI